MFLPSGNPEFNFLVTSSLISLLLHKQIISEKELSKSIEETSKALKEFKSS
jgi:hypothetical protein